MKPKYFLVTISLFLLIMSCSRDESSRVYEDINLNELFGYIGKPIEHFKINYKMYQIVPEPILGEQSFEIETLKGNYLVDIIGKEIQNGVEQPQTLLALIIGKAVFQEEYPICIDHFEQIVRKYFKQLPYQTFIYSNPDSYYGSFGEKVEFSDYKKFYEKIKNEGIKTISHTWILENDVLCYLTLQNGQISFQIKGLPLLYSD